MNGRRDRTKGLRDMAKALREAADAADKAMDVIEKEGCTEEELNESMKDFMWKIMKLGAFQ